MDEDVSKLTDEELDARIAGEEPASPEPAEDAPEKEQPAEETQETEPEAPAPVAEEEAQEEVKNEEPDEKPPSRREQLRIQQLLKRYGPPPEQQAAPSQPERLDYNQALEADPEIIERLEADRDAYGQSQSNQALEQARREIRTSEWRTLLNIDAPQTEAKYPWLNEKDSANFNPAQADAINAEYMSIVGYDERTGLVARPEIRYSDFVEARVEQAKDLARTMTADTTKNIAKQAATTGLRPDGSSAKKMNLNKPAYQMTDEELDAKLKQNGLG